MMSVRLMGMEGWGGWDGYRSETCGFFSLPCFWGLGCCKVCALMFLWGRGVILHGCEMVFDFVRL